MPDNFTPTPVKGRRAHNGAIPTDDQVGVLPAVATNTPQTLTEGHQVNLSTDLAGNLRVTIGEEAEGGPLDVDVTDRQARVLGLTRTDADTRTYETSRTNTQTTALTTNETTEHTATRALLQSEFDATQTLLTSEFNETQTLLQTEFASTRAALEQSTPQVRGADVSDANPLPVVIQVEPGTVRDTRLLTVANVAAGADVALDTAAVTAITGRLLEITAASSVRTRIELQTVVGSTVTPIRVFFVDANESFVYRTVDRDVTTVGTGGLFRLRVRNMDNLSAADVYGSLTFVEG